LHPAGASNKTRKMKPIPLHGESNAASLDTLLAEIRRCELCADHLPLGPKPVLRASKTSRLLIVGQAPGTRVHESGIPWDDASGERLRAWLNIDKKTFYDETQIAIIPMGFCYPGRGKSGDLPPRKECAETWMPTLQEQLSHISTTLLVGQYAIQYYLGKRRQKTLTQTVQNWQDYAPEFFPLPHPSPRNNIWLKRNPWFDEEVIPSLRTHIKAF